jgi:ankyrin repeat protein
MITSQPADSPPPQRWERPLSVPPGYWKKQLPTKYLRIAAAGNVPALLQLLEEHPEFLNKRGSHNRTLLWEATRRGKLAAVQTLVALGADVNATGCYNSETHVQVTPYCAAVYYRRPEVAAYLQANGSVLDIFRTAFLGDLARIDAMLADHPAYLNAEDPFDPIYHIPLVSFAVAGGHAGVAEYLIRRGALVEPYSAQLLHLAARAARFDLLYLLVSSGAAVRAVDVGIFAAVSDLEVLRYLLRQGAPVNRPGKNGFPPLVYVARGDKGEPPDKIQLLLEHGADIHAVGPTGRTALDYASAAGHAQVVRLLVEAAANQDARSAAQRESIG